MNTQFRPIDFEIAAAKGRAARARRAAREQHTQAATTPIFMAAVAPAPRAARAAQRRYEDLTGPQRIELRSSDPQAFNAMRSDWYRRNCPMAANTQPAGVRYEDLTGPDRIALKKSDPAHFDQLRSDWVKRGRPAEARA